MKKYVTITARGNEIESILYTHESYMNSGHQNLVIGTSYLYTPITTCSVENDALSCRYITSKVYGTFGPMYEGSLQCTPDWKVGEKLDIE